MYFKSLLGNYFIFLVRLYQVSFGWVLGKLPSSCRFHPTCSRYFIDAVRIRGPVVGTALGLWRIVRCSPLSQGGFDPVPPGKCGHVHQTGPGKD
ncbi:MAG: membrane protein insertion efficiency factor YidD [Planctomycetes bacterium]|nr:membrane protein insertion efficiency factor YidD [Planctomycetota bacterium]